MGEIRPYREIPRPVGHRVLGNLPDWLGVGRGKSVLQRLERHALECGALARVPLGPTSILCVNDTELVAELLASDDTNYKGWTYILTRAVLDNVLLLNGDEWASGRKLYRNALRDLHISRSIDACTVELIDRIARAPAGEPVDLAKVGYRLVGDVMAHFLARTRMDPALEIDRARIQYELAAIGMDLQCQPWAYLWPARWTELRRSVRRMQAHFTELVLARERDPGNDADDVLARLLALARAGEHTADAGRIADTLINIFFTAHDVLASSTSWCLWLLATHPAIQTRLRAELAALGAGPHDAERLLEVDYLGQVVKEGLRLYPGYALFGRNPQRATQLGGYHVPKSALVIVSPYVIHRLPRYWQRPGEFDPDRWRHDPHGVPPPRPHGAYLPFGAGHRSCLASRIAFPAMKLLVGRIVESLVLQPRHGHAPQLAYCGTGYSENGLLGHLQAAHGQGLRSVGSQRSARSPRSG
jgi:cytochrome P450